MSRGSVDELELRFGNLHITARQSASTGAQGAAHTQAPPAAAAKGAPAVKAKAKGRSAPSRSTRPRHYVVWRVPAGHGLLGIHLCVWWDLEARLPGGDLPGSGVSFVGADSLEEAGDI